MSTQLNRTSQKVSVIRVEIAKLDLQVDCLQEVVKQKQEEATAIKNELAILQGKLQGIQEIEHIINGELEKRLTTLIELRKKAEKETVSPRDGK